MLSKGDDYPIHQRPEPVAWSGTDRNFYDRYFFNGYAPDGSEFFAFALGLYPHLDVIDAHFSVMRNGVQHCIHGSRELGSERLEMDVGPLEICIERPLEVLRVRVREVEGISADIVFTGRSFPIQEPRFIHRFGARAFMDYTRMTQNGRYTGWIEVDGDRRELAPGTMGTRDRSWGIRPIGARDLQPITGAHPPGFFWQWTPLNLTEGSLFFHDNAGANGKSWNTRSAWAPEGATTKDICEGEGQMVAPLIAGTRWPQRASLTIECESGPHALELEPIGRFQMKGLGYGHPKWGHGMHHGDLTVEREDIVLADLDPLAPENVHVQIPVRVTGDAEGMGVFEHLIIGPFAPLGLKSPIDGAQG